MSPKPPDSAPRREYVGLLTQIMTNTLDEDYRTVAARRAEEAPRTADGPARRSTSTAALVVILAVFGVMVGMSALRTQQERTHTLAEREQLVAAIHGRQDDLDELHNRQNALESDIVDLQDTVATRGDVSSSVRNRLETLGVSAGTLAVTGPGLRLTLDDADGTDSGGIIRDTDLQALVNGLWAAGAEAIEIDGHRLSTLTSIRWAGEAITVGYRSLTPPYVVTVIGDPDTLQARLLETEGGQLWLGLEANFGVTFETEARDKVTLSADPREHLLYAEPAGDR